jgi:hypothetical protein
MNFHRLRRPLAVWLALLVAVLGAIAPTLSHGFVRAGQVPLVEICTSLGPRWVEQADSSSSQSGDGTKLHIEHCPFCLHNTDHVVLPPQAVFIGFGILGGSVVPTIGQAFFFIDLHAVAPPPRGPPVIH